MTFTSSNNLARTTEETSGLCILMFVYLLSQCVDEDASGSATQCGSCQVRFEVREEGRRTK
jgi:hypothetical protein